MSLYLDASAILPMLIDEAASPAIDVLMQGLAEPAIVSEFAAGEVASAMSRLVRTKQLDSSDAHARLADFDAWRTSDALALDVEATDVRLAAMLVRRIDLGLRMPDAIHVAMCRRLDLVLVTLDRRLAEAAATLGMTVQMP